MVFTSMGFYPVTPGVPVFDAVSIKLDNGKTFLLSAANNSRVNKYIQSVKLNGNASLRITGPLSGSGGLNKTNAETLVLTGGKLPAPPSHPDLQIPRVSKSECPHLL